jgi:hypothetical protein
MALRGSWTHGRAREEEEESVSRWAAWKGTETALALNLFASTPELPRSFPLPSRTPQSIRFLPHLAYRNPVNSQALALSGQPRPSPFSHQKRQRGNRVFI